MLIRGRDLVISDSDTGGLKQERDLAMFGIMPGVLSHLCLSLGCVFRLTCCSECHFSGQLIVACLR